MYEFDSTISTEHEASLVQLMIEMLGADADEELFKDVLLLVLESVSGFELMSATRARYVADYFWRKYCGKKPN